MIKIIEIVNTYKLNIYQVLNLMFNPIQERGKKSLTRFSLGTSTNVGISLQNFLTFSFKSFTILV